MRCRFVGGYAEIAAAAIHVAASPQGYEIDKSQIRKGAWHPPAVIAAAYGQAFLTVALLKLRPFEAAPVTIVISLAVAILLIDVVSRRAGGFAQFGFRFCHYRYTAAAIVFGVPIAWAHTTLVVHRQGSRLEARESACAWTERKKTDPAPFPETSRDTDRSQV